MQSQQKRLKWSRGETAEALEERTDTGITSASVELMENCIPDIYGNISRRPALKLLSSVIGSTPYTHGFFYDQYLQVIPFYITENDLILIGIHYTGDPEFIRIQNGNISKITTPSRVYPHTRAPNGYFTGNYTFKKCDYAQQNNFLVIADAYHLYKMSFSVSSQGVITPDCEELKFSAGWYAPNGTQTKSVTSTDLSGLSIDGNFTNYTYTNAASQTTVYSLTSTGLNGQTGLEDILEAIPLGSIVKMPNIGTNFRVEGYTLHNNDVLMFGELLTPVADPSAHDDTLAVEYGYVSLQPTQWGSTETYPHPMKLTFNEQRLWAGGWKFNILDEYPLVIGSQIARYDDFENNYNQANEAITLEIDTKFKERILHIVDYNGLKIMTDSYEYAYDSTNGVVKQSANGSLEQCEPIIFDSLCLYVDSTGKQVKAMQYEFQSNIFNSSTINLVAPHDLVWYPLSLAAYEDKENSTGKYLFVLNQDTSNSPKLSVCNFVPSNQANIWNRWSFAQTGIDSYTSGVLFGVVHTKYEPIFLLTMNEVTAGTTSPQSNYIYPARINWKDNLDAENPVYTTGGFDYYCAARNGNDGKLITLPNTQVAVYADGVFKWLDTTTSTGALTKSIEGLTNVTVGLPINSTIVSHPIDVGGKTKSIKKRIGKARMSVHGTEADVITINGKTGYMNPAKDQISFYGVTGMKNEIKYTITNKNGGMFHLESLLMNIEYGTLDS